MSNSLDKFDGKFIPYAFGFNNYSATCHFNALIQSLISCSSVVKAIINNSTALKSYTGKAIYNFIIQIFTNKDSILDDQAKKIFDALIKDLDNRHTNITYGQHGYTPECTLEGFGYMLDVCGDVLSKLFYHRYEVSTICNTCKKCVHKLEETSNVFYIFNHDNESIGTPYEFSERLRQYSVPIDVYHCETCNKKTTATRKYLLKYAPEILVCVFNLYSQRKLNYFPPYCTFMGHDSILRYRLVSQIMHGGGHYVTRALRRDGNSYLFNDASVIPADFTYDSSNVFMIMYHFI